MKRIALLGTLSALLCLCANASAQASFEMIASPVAPTWFNYALNGDGTVMVANYGGEIFRWTENGGFVDLGMGDFLNTSIGVSADGKTIVAGIVGSDGASTPGLWRRNSG